MGYAPVKSVLNHCQIVISFLALLNCFYSVGYLTAAEPLTPLKTISQATGTVSALRFSVDNQSLYLGTYGQLQVVSVELAEILHKLDKLSGYITSIAASPDGKLLAAGHYQKVTLFNAEDYSQLAQLKHHRGQVTGAKFLSDQQLLTAADDGTVALWKLTDDVWSLAESLEYDEPITSLAVDPVLKWAAIGLGDETRVTRPGSVVIIDLESFREKKSHVIHKSAVASLAATNDGKSVLSGSFDESIIVTTISDGLQTGIFKQHARPVNCITSVPNQDVIFSGSGGRYKEKNELIGWTLSTGEVLIKSEPHAGKITAVAVSSDGKFLATGSQDETTVIWDLAAFLK
ncbi:MAG TPA: hypothetical protein DD473_24415 [Planctomycetaceae bacterium]|nr:hypothetical protein [Planctomycetaceae bacterium]|tara:strand:- start:94 stop:1128 length:1035 start_codon:yes stop_codon:yes gene_type:complete